MLRLDSRLLVSVGLGLLAGCGAGPPPPSGGSPADANPPFQFEDARAAAGIDFPLDFTKPQEPGIRESIGHGAALLDADGDGLLDVLLTGPDRVALYRNRGNWRFETVPEAGFRQPGFWQGAAVGDVNGDGKPDLFLSGYGCSALYLNRGEGRFTDATRGSGLENNRSGSWQTSAAFADVDLDGRLDLYVTRYVDLAGKSGLCSYLKGSLSTACNPLQFSPQQGRLYRGVGAGRFTDVTDAMGLMGHHGNGLGVAFGDINSDGYPDLYLANDQVACDLYLNQGGRRFTEIGLTSGTSFNAEGSTQAGMGVDFGDYDDDGREDLVVTNFQREPTSVYHNDGAQLFTNAAFTSHIGGATTGGVGWGVKWADLDNDGRLDLALVNGHPLYRVHQLDPASTERQRFQLFRNEDGRRFSEALSVGPDLPRALSGRALCVGDLDNDGRLDLLLPDIGGQPLLLRNTTPGGRHWLRVRLSGVGTEGAVVTLQAGGRSRIRRATTGGSYLSASDPRVHFGLGELSSVDFIEVRYPGGKRFRMASPAVDQEVTALAQ